MTNRPSLTVAALLLPSLLAACGDGAPDAATGSVPSTASSPTANGLAILPPTGNLEAADPLERMRYESVLERTWDNPRPPIDELLALVDELGRSATILEETLGLAPDGSATTGQLRLVDAGLEASFSATPRAFELHLVQSADELFAHRSLRIGVEIDGTGAVVRGHVTVVHHFDLSDKTVLGTFGDRTRAAGWQVTGSSVDGMRAEPTLARRTRAGESDEPTLIVGAEASGFFDDPTRPTAIVRRDDRDVRAWRNWAEVHAELAAVR